MIKFYSSATSPNALKVRLMLAEAGIDFEEIRVRRDQGENRTPAFLRISATGTVPAIEDTDTGATLFESSAILLYLADHSGRFLPADPAGRAAVYRWLIFEAANLSPGFDSIYQLAYQEGDWIEPALDFMRRRTEKHLQLIDAELGTREYIAGDCSIVDFAVFPYAILVEDFLDLPLSRLPHLARWTETMRARSAVQHVLGN
jgi:glutathione S-transferase